MAVVKRQRKSTAQSQIKVAQLALLRDQMPPPDSNPFVQFGFEREARELWQEHGEAIVIEWIAQQPGTRPLCWYLYQCPVSALALGVDASGNRPNTRAGEWALYPDRVPTEEKQRDFLGKHGLLTEGE